MKIIAIILITCLVFIADIWCGCDVCQGTNFVACHEENAYSLCVNGSATNNFITCPEDYVCTAEPYVCYPKSEAKPTCERTTNLCGVCGENKVYACINETTIAFCYGADKPFKGTEVSYCLEGTVCDIHSRNGFCTESSLAEPSCVTSDNKTYATTITMPAMTTETTSLDTTILEAIQPSGIATTTVTESSSTTTTTKEPTRTMPHSTAAVFTTTATTTKILTPTTSTTTKATSASIPTDPETFCKLYATTGSFWSGDPTCRTFVFCYMAAGSITGLRKKCPRNQYFGLNARRCSSEKPDSCI